MTPKLLLSTGYQSFTLIVSCQMQILSNPTGDLVPTYFPTGRLTFFATVFLINRYTTRMFHLPSAYFSQVYLTMSTLCNKNLHNTDNTALLLHTLQNPVTSIFQKTAKAHMKATTFSTK